jgi:hypothetical protein
MAMASSYLLLATGFWSLVAGDWSLATGHCSGLRVAGFGLRGENQTNPKSEI